jgi:ATP-dependent DNA helicase RecQ
LRTGLETEKLREAVSGFLEENEQKAPAELARAFSEWLSGFMRANTENTAAENQSSTGMFFDRKKVTKALKEKFKLDSFRTGQLESIKNIMTGHHTLLVMPTASGKSLCYQLPALLSEGLTLVISPLISLMKDQVDSLNSIGIAATSINSSFTPREQLKRIAGMQCGEYDLVYIAPERLESSVFQEALDCLQVDLLAIDEAHCISRWGYDFRPSFQHIPAAWKKVGEPVILATTATATPRVQQDIKQQLSAGAMDIMVQGFNRPNLYFEVQQTKTDYDKEKTLKEIFENFSKGSAIVYVGTQNEAEEICSMIETEVGLTTTYYHAGIEREKRKRIQKDFLQNRIQIMVATNAFGMGIDKPDIRLVVHYRIPDAVESYYQQAGRAGRDGKPARCVLLFNNTDRQLQHYFINNETLAETEVYRLYDLIRQSPPGDKENPLPVGRSAHCNIEQLQVASRLNETKFKIAVNILEAAGWVENLGMRNQKQYFKIKPEDYLALDKQISSQQNRRREKFDRLQKMVAYADINLNCRRSYILHYFGEEYEPAQGNCCDCCDGERKITEKCLTESEKTILFAVEKLGQKMKERRLALILSGSESEDILSKYGELKIYGTMASMKPAEILDCIKTMLEKRLLKRTRTGKLTARKDKKTEPREPDYDYPVF